MWILFVRDRDVRDSADGTPEDHGTDFATFFSKSASDVRIDLRGPMGASVLSAKHSFLSNIGHNYITKVVWFVKTICREKAGNPHSSSRAADGSSHSCGLHILHFDISAFDIYIVFPIFLLSRFVQMHKPGQHHTTVHTAKATPERASG